MVKDKDLKWNVKLLSKQSIFTENHDVNAYNSFISSCLIVAFSRLELGDNIVYISPYACIYCMYTYIQVYISAGQVLGNNSFAMIQAIKMFRFAISPYVSILYVCW